MVSATISRMAKKKSDRHAKKTVSLRLNDAMLEMLDELATKNGSDRTEEIRIAVRKHLAENGMWPPSQPAKG